MSTKIINPGRPSECVAALSLSDDSNKHPFGSLFYTMDKGRTVFYGLEVTGLEDEGDNAKLVYHKTTNPDEARILISGVIQPGGETRLHPRVTLLRDEEHAKTYVALMRAAMQLHGELK